ncbi:MAG: gliding motility protein GldN [Cytophagaceae bacterium]|nr:gliding motility protein GldN [Cytophagaceae bacterium]
MKKLSVILLGLTFSTAVVFAQETETTTTDTPTEPTTTTTTTTGDPVMQGGFNKYSVRPVHESDVMFKKTIIRAVDLREKQNKPLFSKNKEITKLLIEAVERGDLKPYANDSLEEGRQLTIEEFKENIKVPSDQAELTQEEKDIMLANGDSSFMQAGAGGPNYYFPRDLYQMQIKEDLIFDKQRSRMYYDVHAITILVPADHPSNIKGIELTAASFAYKDVVKVLTDNPNAIWYNPQNDAQHKSLADAVELRLFSSYIIKVSNPDDAYLVDIYGGDQVKGIMSSQWAAFELLEYEHNLWEF